MIRFVFFLALSCTLLACQTSVTTEDTLTEDIKAYFSKNGLDKRTTFLDVKLENGVLVGKAQNQQLIDDFVGHINTDRKSPVESKVVPIKTRTAYVRNSVGNARSKPKHSAELATQYLMGQKVDIIDETEEWFYIQGPDNYLAWIDKGGVLTEDKVSKEWLNGDKAILKVNEIIGLSAKDSSVATDLVFGNVLARKNGSYLTPDGTQLKLSDSILSSENEIPYKSVKLVLDKAYSLMGRPYLWGGTSAKGMDCSGFTRTAFMNTGYLLGRDASLQVHEGEEVDKDNISQWQPGDLLFFGNLREDGSQRITHVAIHTENGDMIHASQRVRVESLNPDSELYNKDRAESLMRVKRIF